MTASTHVYAASVGGNALKVRGGSLSLDAGRAPHVQGDLEVAFPGTWTTGYAYGPNLVAGSDFEVTALVPWDISGAAFTLSTTNPHGGARRLAIASGASPRAARSLGDFPVQEGQVYAISVWARSGASYDGTASNSKLSVRDVANESLITAVPYALANLPTASVWVERTGTFTVPAGVTSVYFDLRGDHTAGFVYLDDIVIRRRVVVPVWTPAPAVYDLLDPRSSPAPRVTVTAQKDADPARTFNLHVRERSINHRAGSVTLRLASDEGLLDDYAPAAADRTPVDTLTTMRQVCNYVLGKAIPGATLAASPATDADAKAYWAATNIFTDPRFQGTTGGGYTVTGVTLGSDTTWVASENVKATLLSAPTTSDGYLTLNNAVSGLPYGMKQGGTYVVSATGSVRSTMSGTTYTDRRRRICVFTRPDPSVAFTMVSSAAVPSTVQTGASAGTRVGVEFTIPDTPTAEVMIRAYHGASAGSIAWRKFQLVERSAASLTGDMEFFTGLSSDANYTYRYTGTVDLSTSVRAPVAERSPQALIWDAGQSALEFLHPLVQAAGLRLVCDENRTWTLRDEAYTAAGSLSVRAGVNVVEADETISRDAGYWFDARVTRYRWTDAKGVQQERIDAYAPAGYTRMTLVDVASAYPGPGRSQYAVRRAAGIGREVTVETVSDWTARAEMPTSVVLENAPAGAGTTQSVTFNLDNDRMTVTARTVDIPAGAIDLLVGTVNALTGTINSL